jgi:hypothetical protein
MLMCEAGIAGMKVVISAAEKLFCGKHYGIYHP